MAENKGYFAVIPSNVRYAKIPQGAKLLYGEITALCNEKGYCWANNKYFAELYEVSERTVGAWLCSLENNDFIHRYYEYKENTNEIKERRIVLGVEENFKGVLKKSSRGIEENFQDNNTYINNTQEYIYIVEYLNEKAGTNYRHQTKATQKLINGRLSEGYTVDDFKKVIDKKVAEWKGTQFEQYLTPKTLFAPSHFENYLNQKIVTEKKPAIEINPKQREGMVDIVEWRM